MFSIMMFYSYSYYIYLNHILVILPCLLLFQYYLFFIIYKIKNTKNHKVTVQYCNLISIHRKISHFIVFLDKYLLYN